MKKFLIVFSILIIFIFCFSNCFALTKLYETSTSQVLNTGTTLTKYKRLTDKGWLAINVIEVDLKDDNTTVSVLTSQDGLQTFQDVNTMLMNENNCIAAVNADFFNGNYKKGNIIGMTIKNGEMLTSTYYENELKDTLASFYIDDNNGAAFDYFSNKLTLRNENNGETYSIAEMNKWSSNYEYPVVYTKKWGDKSLGLSLDIALTELVVQNGVVKEIRTGQDAVDIPSSGFVVCAIGESAENMKNIFKVGDRVLLDIETKINVSKVKTAVSGGSMLVKNGQIADFTHVIYGTNPRTAIGLSRDCSKVYLVTIDGRQKVSIGVTQAELAEILVELGVYNAMNLDGGGSTTMIAKELGDTTPTIENYPSDGTLRKVGNSIGVINTSKKGDLKYLKIEVDEENIFVNCEKNITVKGYDEYYHPVEIDVDDIKWSYSGVDVFINENVLKAGSDAGIATITASIDEAKGKTDVNVLNRPSEIIISPKSITISPNDTVTFKISGRDKNGYSSNLKNSEVTWNVDGGSIKEGSFTASKEGNYIVDASIGEIKSYALVCVSSNKSKVINNFESENFHFVNYPSEVEGNVKVSMEQVYDGKKSAKLTYNFTKTTQTRAAYLRFNDEVVLEKGANILKVMFYSDSVSSDKVKVKLKDANGEVQYLTLLNEISETGWKELSLNLKNVVLPATLIDLYVVQDKEKELTSGSVFFDKLTVEYAGGVLSSDYDLPSDIKQTDELNRYVDLEGNDSFRVTVSPEFYSGILLEHLKIKRLEETINKNSEIVIYPYKNSEEMLVNISKEKVVSDLYSVSNKGSLTIISLNVASGGLRATDGNQWISLQNDIKKANKNVLIVLNGNLDSFNDDMEKDAFTNMLFDMIKSTDKNIWVIQKGKNTEFSVDRGIRYLTIGSYAFKEGTLEEIKNTKYIMITINENEMTYEMKNVW